MTLEDERTPMDRIRNAVVSFALNFLLGYVVGRLIGDRSTGTRAGVVLGAAGAAASWRLSGEFEDTLEFPGDDPIEIEIEE